MNGDMMKKVIAPKGYSFKIKSDRDYGSYDEVFVIELHKKKKGRIGTVRLVKSYKGCYCTHSDLDDDYHNRGLGTLMYAKAIQWGLKQGYRIRSSGGSSFEAQRVWRGSSLKRWFDIKIKRDHHSSDYDTFYPYPKKEKKQRPVSAKKHSIKKS